MTIIKTLEKEREKACPGSLYQKSKHSKVYRFGSKLQACMCVYAAFEQSQILFFLSLLGVVQSHASSPVSVLNFTQQKLCAFNVESPSLAKICAELNYAIDLSFFVILKFILVFKKLFKKSREHKQSAAAKSLFAENWRHISGSIKTRRFN